MEIHSAFISPFHAAFRSDAQVSGNGSPSEPNWVEATDSVPDEASDEVEALDESPEVEGFGSENADDQGAVLDLTEEEQQEVELLQARDAEVRAHELAHMAAGGAYVTGAASYSYQTGPDGRRYAIGGEVGIDTSMSSDAAGNLQKARTLIRAALAPAEPSAQDYRVAASARSMEMEAIRDLRNERLEEQERAAEEAVSDAESSLRAASPDVSGTGSEEGADLGTLDPYASRKHLDARISAFFAGPREEGLSQFA